MILALQKAGSLPFYIHNVFLVVETTVCVISFMSRLSNNELPTLGIKNKAEAKQHPGTSKTDSYVAG